MNTSFKPSDFSKASFATDVNGHTALRRSDVSHGMKWTYFRGGSTYERTDYQMAEEMCWTPVVATAVAESTPPVRIASPQDLAEFAKMHDLRSDWHEPDNSDINARIIGKHLDNDMGSTTRHEHADWGGEFNVVLTHMDSDDREIQTDLAVVNLATLLSWAAELGDAQR